jgi:hypothetical protein
MEGRGGGRRWPKQCMIKVKIIKLKKINKKKSRCIP